MRKPRCFHCDAALKRIYERKGSEARFDTVHGWWYCNDCRKVQKGPQYPSEDPDDYLDSEAAVKFPKISHVMQHSNQYIDVEELNQSFYKQVNYDPDLTEKFDTMMTFFMRYPTIRRQLQKEKQPKLFPFWVCEICEESRIIKQDEYSDLESIEDLEDQIPVHCNTSMTIKIIPIQSKTLLDFSRDQLDSLEENYLMYLEQENYEESAINLLDLTLYHLAWPRDIMGLHRGTFAAFLGELKKPDRPLQGTWAFEILISLIQAFTTPNSELEVALITGNYDPVQETDFKVNGDTVAILSSIISDIISSLLIDESMSAADRRAKIPYYRQLCNKIILNIRHGEKYRENIQEFSKLRKLQSQQQVAHKLHNV